jgi:hypothetical protein
MPPLDAEAESYCIDGDDDDDVVVEQESNYYVDVD